MAINEFSLKPTLDLDFSNEENLNKSLKAKKILGNVEINNIVNNIKNNDFTLNIVLKYILEQISNLKEEQNKIKSNVNNTNDLETKKQQTLEKFNKLFSLLNDCAECNNMNQEQIKKIDEKINSLLEKYPSGVGSMFNIQATHLDRV